MLLKDKDIKKKDLHITRRSEFGGTVLFGRRCLIYRPSS